MNTNPPKDGDQSGKSRGPVTPTLKMITDHAIRLAWINGRRASDLKPSDYVEAKRDLMGETDNDPRQPILESGAEPYPESDPTGKKIPATEDEDEDEEGSSENETSVEPGVSDAEQDRRVHPAKPIVKPDE